MNYDNRNFFSGGCVEITREFSKDQCARSRYVTNPAKNVTYCHVAEICNWTSSMDMGMWMHSRWTKKITHMWRWDTLRSFFLTLNVEFWKIRKTRILKKWKKKLPEILHMCTKNHNQMRHSSWDTDKDDFLSFGSFFPLFLPFSRKPKFWKNEKSIWRCHHLKLMQQKRRSNDVCLLRYGVQQIFFVNWGHFLFFYPLLTPKIKIWKKCKKHLEILSFYTCAP